MSDLVKNFLNEMLIIQKDLNNQILSSLDQDLDQPSQKSTGKLFSECCFVDHILYLISVPVMDRCFSVVYPGKEGGHEGQHGSASSAQNLGVCKQRCLDSPDCESLSYFSSFAQCKIYSVKTPESSLIDQSDAVHIEKSCPTGEFIVMNKKMTRAVQLILF